MKFPLLFFSLIPLFLLSTIRRIENISYRSTNQGDTIALIQLTDGSIWKWCPDVYSENLIRRWSPGDEILIQPINHPGLGLKNLSKPYYTPIVALSFNSYPIFPIIEHIDTCRGLIHLTDGTKWQIAYDFNKRTLFYWAKGDRIIPVRGIQNNFELINIDISYENRCQIERAMEVLPFDPSKTYPSCEAE